jgi:hypothetical protein
MRLFGCNRGSNALRRNLVLEAATLREKMREYKKSAWEPLLWHQAKNISQSMRYNTTWPIITWPASNSNCRLQGSNNRGKVIHTYIVERGRSGENEHTLKKVLQVFIVYRNAPFHPLTALSCLHFKYIASFAIAHFFSVPVLITTTQDQSILDVDRGARSAPTNNTQPIITWKKIVICLIGVYLAHQPVNLPIIWCSKNILNRCLLGSPRFD